MSELDLRTKRGSGWSVGEVAAHVVSSMEDGPALIDALRQGRDHLNLPPLLSEPLKRVYTWWSARGATGEGLAKRFDVASRQFAALIDAIASEEWGRGGRAYGEGYWTVEHALWCRGEHIEEHIGQIRLLLGR